MYIFTSVRVNTEVNGSNEFINKDNSSSIANASGFILAFPAFVFRTPFSDSEKRGFHYPQHVSHLFSPEIQR